MYIATGFVTLVHSYIQVTARSIDYILETDLVKVIQLKYPTISYTNKLYEGNKKTLLTQTLHRKTLNEIASQNQKICSPAVGHKPRFAREFIAKLLCDDNLNAEIKWKEHIIK